MSAVKTGEDGGKRRGGRTNYKPWLRLFKRLAIVALVLLIGFLAWQNWEKIAPEALLDWTDQQFGDAQSGDGFPRGIDGNEVVSMTEVNQHLVVLSDTALQFYNANAALVEERGHSFTKPTLHTAGKYVLLTELGGNRIRLDTRRETAMELTLENRLIYATDLLSNGMTALILNSTSQSYMSEIDVRNQKGESVFTYKCNKYLLTDISLSANGKQVAAVGTTAENGILKSVLLVITLSNGTVKEYAGTDVLLHNVTFFSSGTVLAVGDREVWSLSHGDDQPQKTACDGFETVGYASTATMAGVALRRSGSTDAGELWVFDADGKRVQIQEYVGSYRSLSVRGADMLLLTDKQLCHLRTTGLQGQYEAPSDSLMAVTYRKAPILLTLNELKRMEK